MQSSMFHFSPLATYHPLLTSSTKTPHTFPPNSSNSPSFVASSFTWPFVNACTSCNETKRLLNYTVIWKAQRTQILCHFPRSPSWKFNTCIKKKYAYHHEHILECIALQQLFSSVPNELNTRWSAIHSSVCSVHCQLNCTDAGELSIPVCVQFIANWTGHMLEYYPLQHVFNSLPTELDTCWSAIHFSMCSVHCQLNWTHAGVLSTPACVHFSANWTGHMLECYPLQHVFSSLPTELDTCWSATHSSMCSVHCQLNWTHAGVVSTPACVHFSANWKRSAIPVSQ